ncbi:MAG: DNA repair protein RecN, partial [Cyanobacteria bacterium J083]
RLVRQGAKKIGLEGTFLAKPELKQWLQKQEIDLLEDDKTIVCCREIIVMGKSTRSRYRLNGVLVNLPIIKELRPYLLEITAQGQTVSLMLPEIQRELLDVYGGEPLLKQLAIVEELYHKYQKIQTKLAKSRSSEQARLQKLDLLQYQLQELQAANLTSADELEQLQQEHDRLLNVVELQQLSYQSYEILYQNPEDKPTVTDLLGKAESYLINLVNYDPSLESILAMIQSASTQIIEAGLAINSYGESLEADPDRLTELEARITQLNQICRKYGTTLADVISYQDKLVAELAQINQSEDTIATLEAKYKLIQSELEQACVKLTKIRQKTARKLEKQLIKALKPLAMDKVIFVCQLTSIAPTAKGSDRVTFYFSPNPGEKVQPLATIASGGEMSRFLLALKACFSQAKKGASTLIFDEIDAGVSGKVAEAIAEKLHHLSQKNQILCVTHQPLVAAMADNHLKVEKTIVETDIIQAQNGDSSLPPLRTVVRVETLHTLKQRIQELAQITGGNSAQEATAFAESMLKKAKIFRQISQNSGK